MIFFKSEGDCSPCSLLEQFLDYNENDCYEVENCGNQIDLACHAVGLLAASLFMFIAHRVYLLSDISIAYCLQYVKHFFQFCPKCASGNENDNKVLKALGIKGFAGFGKGSNPSHSAKKRYTPLRCVSFFLCVFEWEGFERPTHPKDG